MNYVNQYSMKNDKNWLLSLCKICWMYCKKLQKNTHIDSVSGDYQVSRKRSPLAFFADFAEMTWNFNIKFYTFIESVHVRFCAK